MTLMMRLAVAPIPRAVWTTRTTGMMPTRKTSIRGGPLNLSGTRFDIFLLLFVLLSVLLCELHVRTYWYIVTNFVTAYTVYTIYYYTLKRLLLYLGNVKNTCSILVTYVKLFTSACRRFQDAQRGWKRRENGDEHADGHADGRRWRRFLTLDLRANGIECESIAVRDSGGIELLQLIAKRMLNCECQIMKWNIAANARNRRLDPPLLQRSGARHSAVTVCEV